jgi:hypothetical protein
MHFGAEARAGSGTALKPRLPAAARSFSRLRPACASTAPRLAGDPALHRQARRRIVGGSRSNCAPLQLFFTTSQP